MNCRNPHPLPTVIHSNRNNLLFERRLKALLNVVVMHCFMTFLSVYLEVIVTIIVQSM